MSERERPSAPPPLDVPFPPDPPAPLDKWERGILEVTFLDTDEAGGQEVLAWKETIANLIYVEVKHPTVVQGIPFHNLKGWAFVPHEDYEREPAMTVTKRRRQTGARRKLTDGGT